MASFSDRHSASFSHTVLQMALSSHQSFGFSSDLLPGLLGRELKSVFGVMSFFFDTSQKKKTGEVWQCESLRPFGVSFHEKKSFPA